MCKLSLKYLLLTLKTACLGTALALELLGCQYCFANKHSPNDRQAIESNYCKVLAALMTTELQIIFESNAYLPRNFLLNADFQNLKLYFHPLYFSHCIKENALLY